MSLDDTDTIDDEQNAEHWRKVMLKEAESKRAQVKKFMDLLPWINN